MKSQHLSMPTMAFGVSKKFWISLAVACWLFFVLANIPAVWGAFFMTRAGTVGMTGVSGSIWSGRASLVSVKVKDSNYSLGQLTWNIKLLSLLMLKPCAMVKTAMDDQQFNGRVCIGLNGTLSVNEATSTFPASIFQPLVPVAIDGLFSLQIEKLSVQKNQLTSLKGKFNWMGAKVFNGTNWMMLGSFGADAVDDGKSGITAHIFDVTSPMQVDIVLALMAPSGGSAKGTLGVNELFDREAKVSSWLTVFATPAAPDAQGNLQYTIDMNL